MASVTKLTILLSLAVIGIRSDAATKKNRPHRHFIFPLDSLYNIPPIVTPLLPEYPLTPIIDENDSHYILNDTDITNSISARPLSTELPVSTFQDDTPNLNGSSTPSLLPFVPIIDASEDKPDEEDIDIINDDDDDNDNDKIPQHVHVPSAILKTNINPQSKDVRPLKISDTRNVDVTQFNNSYTNQFDDPYNSNNVHDVKDVASPNPIEHDNWKTDGNHTNGSIDHDPNVFQQMNSDSHLNGSESEKRLNENRGQSVANGTVSAKDDKKADVGANVKDDPSNVWGANNQQVTLVPVQVIGDPNNLATLGNVINQEGIIPLLLQNYNVDATIGNSVPNYLNGIVANHVPNNMLMNTIPYTPNVGINNPNIYAVSNIQQAPNNNGVPLQIPSAVQNVAAPSQYPNLCVAPNNVNTPPLYPNGNVANINGNLYAVVTVPTNNIGHDLVPCNTLGNNPTQNYVNPYPGSFVNNNLTPGNFYTVTNIPSDSLGVSNVNFANNNGKVPLNSQGLNVFSVINGTPNNNLFYKQNTPLNSDISRNNQQLYATINQ